VLILLRHGQSTLNAAGCLAGRLDVPLTDVGREQAAAGARAVLALGRPVRVVSSPLIRARETAEALGLPVEVDERWIELDYGEFDGRPLGDVPADFWTALRADPTWRPAGGESLVDVGRRVRAACDELGPAAGEGDVVVVTHVSPLKAAVAWALGVGDEVSWRLYLATGSITRIALTGRGPSLHGFNDTGHLGGPAPGAGPGPG